MQRFQSAITGYFIIVLCFFCMASELMAENRVFLENNIVGADSIVVASPITGGIIQLAKPINSGEVPGKSKAWNRVGEVVVSWGDEPTKVKIIGNSVLVPVTIVYGGNEVNVYLLLDTGSTRTAIHTEIADQLSINLNQTRKARVQVVGGTVLEVRAVRISRLTVGPHTKSNLNIIVVPQKSSEAKHDGLLGMDILRELKYEVDFKKQVIVWE